MKLSKLQDILNFLDGCGFKFNGCSIYGNALTGELTLELNTQPSRDVDEVLRKWGFIVNDHEYIYRPK